MKAKIYNIGDIKEIAAAMKAGAAAVLPTDTVYGLCVCAAAAGAQAALDKLNKIKNNPSDKPPQILCSIGQAFRLAAPSESFTAAAKLWPGALTIVAKASPSGRALMGGADTIGLRAPDDDFVLSLINLLGAPLFASSANMHGDPVCETEAAVKRVFENKVDIIVPRGDIKTAPSAVIDLSGPKPRVIRAGVMEAELLAVIASVP